MSNLRRSSSQAAIQPQVSSVCLGVNEDAAPAVRTRPWRRVDAPTVVLHWLVAILFLVSLTSGFRVVADAPDAGWSRAVAGVIAPQGTVLFWHIASACALLAVATGYAVFLLCAKQVKRVQVNANRFRNLLSLNRRKRLYALNVLIYWLAYFLLAVGAFTGLLMYSDSVNRAHWAMADIHQGIAWGLIGYVALHVLAQLAMAGWRALYAIVIPRRAYGSAAFAAVITVASAGSGFYLLDSLMVRTLEMARVQESPSVDGVFDDPAWRSARPVTIQTAGGANLFSGGTAVTVRAVRNDTHAYFLFEWQDPTRSLKHHPLQKTAAGWRMVQSGYARGDEIDYYEDKFAVMLSRDDRFAALRSAHLGPRPIEDLPGASGQRGLHYTADGTVLDVWHWMAVRTDPMGLAEDDYFGALRPPPDKSIQRYAGGYGLDPAVRGGAIGNWKDLLEGPISRRFDGAVVPRFLPTDPADITSRLGVVDLDPESSDDGKWWLPSDLLHPYTAELDARFPEGSVIPSVVLGKPIKGDRGDVSAIGRWKEGIWRLEMKRALDTNSPYDIAITEGTYLWVAVFDHAQTRHSWHMRPLAVRFRSGE